MDDEEIMRVCFEIDRLLGELWVEGCIHSDVRANCMKHLHKYMGHEWYKNIEEQRKDRRINRVGNTD